MSKRRPNWKTLVPALLACLAGCGAESDLGELRQYAERTVNRPPGQIEPLPEFVSYEPFTYSAANLRSPFEAPAEFNAQLPQSEEVRPDENRPREYLEQFSIQSLTMVGSLRRGGRAWALVRDETGRVHRVTVGNYLGKNHGRIIGVTPTQINLVEIVPSGNGGWIERPQVLALQQPGGQVPASR